MSKSEFELSRDIRNMNEGIVRIDAVADARDLKTPDVSNAPDHKFEADDVYGAEHGHHRRAAWRQRLVQAERGLVRGIRSDSAFFVHFFGISVVIAAALVLGIGWMQWIGIAGCLTLVLTAEMFNQALKALAQSNGLHASPGGQRALAIGTAAVLVACLGSTIVLALVFWQRFQQLF